MEAYQAYADYNDMADLIQELLRFVAKDVLGTQTLMIGDKEVDLSKPFVRKSIVDLIKEKQESTCCRRKLWSKQRKWLNLLALMQVLAAAGESCSRSV